MLAVWDRVCTQAANVWIFPLVKDCQFGVSPVNYSDLSTKVCEKELSSESDLNSLLVKRQIDNPSPGAVTGGN